MSLFVNFNNFRPDNNGKNNYVTTAPGNNEGGVNNKGRHIGIGHGGRGSGTTNGADGGRKIDDGGIIARKQKIDDGGLVADKKRDNQPVTTAFPEGGFDNKPVTTAPAGIEGGIAVCS